MIRLFIPDLNQACRPRRRPDDEQPDHRRSRLLVQWAPALAHGRRRAVSAQRLGDSRGNLNGLQRGVALDYCGIQAEH